MKAFFVTRRLAFGSAITSWQHAERLRALGITHVVNLRWSTNNKKVRSFKHIWLRFHDDKKPRPAWFYRRALRFYQRAIGKPEGKLFVMCQHGICRSASLTYFLLRASRIGPRKAEALVLGARPRAKVMLAYRESCEEYLRRRGRW